MTGQAGELYFKAGVRRPCATGSYLSQKGCFSPCLLFVLTHIQRVIVSLVCIFDHEHVTQASTPNDLRWINQSPLFFHHVLNNCLLCGRGYVLQNYSKGRTKAKIHGLNFRWVQRTLMELSGLCVWVYFLHWWDCCHNQSSLERRHVWQNKSISSGVCSLKKYDKTETL